MEINREPGAAERGQPAPAPPDESVAGPRSNLLANWRRWIRPAFYAAYGLVVLAVVPLVILDVVRSEEANFQKTLAGVGFFAMVVAIPVSVWGIINHMVCYTRPAIQKYIIRILWLIPIFELNSWFAMRFPVTQIYLDTFRQLYQAFVIYSYVFYLLTFYEDVPDFHNRLVLKPQIKSPPPCCCVRAVPNQRIINRCKAGVLNYTVIRIVFSIVSITTDLLGKFNEGNYSPRSAYLWVTIIVSTSQIWAIFCMALLRKATREELKMLPRSTAQFLGIQVVIFCANFQSILLTLLAEFGALNPRPAWGYDSAYAFATMLQDFLICLELIPGAIIFSYSFDYQRYNTDSERRSILPKSFKQMLNVSHVKNNIIEHLRFGGPSFTRQRSDDSTWDEQVPDSPTPLQAPTAFPPTDAKPPGGGTLGQQNIPLPDIIHDAVPHLATGDQDGGAHHNCGYEHREGQNATEGGFRADASDVTDELSEGTFSIDDEDMDDDDEDNDNGHSVIDPQLDKPPGTPNRRRVKKVSVSGMTFEDMDWDHIKSHRSDTMDSASEA